MEKPTTILSQEHQNILKVIGAMIKEIGALQPSQPIDEIFWAKIIDFIQNYADKFHHAKEEEILFKELCKDSVQLHCNPIEQMLYEHNLGRDFVKGLAKGIEENNQNRVMENARHYVQLLQEHIFKEDNVLYPMAEQVLDQQTQELILDKFKRAESEKFEKGAKEKYLAMVKDFEKRTD